MYTLKIYRIGEYRYNSNRPTQEQEKKLFVALTMYPCPTFSTSVCGFSFFRLPPHLAVVYTFWHE
jgi:hypothetical protein